MCRVLGVSVSGFYDWFERPQSLRQQANARLPGHIRTSFVASDRTYGSPRIVRALQTAGQACPVNRVARLMQAAGIKARHKRRRMPGQYRRLLDAAHHDSPTGNGCVVDGDIPARQTTSGIASFRPGSTAPATTCVPMSSITLKGPITQNAGYRLSAISARYNLKIYNVLSECVREIGGSPIVLVAH
jgi:hypothetical protein